MGFSAILGLRTDLHLTGQDYSWATSMFYFGYLAGAVIAAKVFVHLPVGKVLATTWWVSFNRVAHDGTDVRYQWHVGSHSHVDGVVQERIWSLGCEIFSWIA